MSLRRAFGALLIATACVGQPPPPPGQDGSTTEGEPGSTTNGPSSTTDGPSTTTAITGSATDGDTTAADTFGTLCGDGIVEAPEECDLGALNGSGMSCTSECTNNVCGDGYVGPGEGCDDGNESNEDLCTTECGPTSCGDAVVQASEECDEGDANSETGACLPSCLAATCGDMFIHERVETCDSNNIGGQSCEQLGFGGGVLLCQDDCAQYDTSNCYACGDGDVNPGEQCDGMSLGGNDCGDVGAPGQPSGGTPSCNAACQLTEGTCTFCGDNVREGTETCDGIQLGGATCASVLGAGHGGTLACTPGCTFDIGGCCLNLGQPCTGTDECCGGDCHPMNDVCQ